MNELQPVSPSPQFKDRPGGLIGFGILMIVCGCFSALFVPMMFLGQALTAKQAEYLGVPVEGPYKAENYRY